MIRQHIKQTHIAKTILKKHVGSEIIQENQIYKQ